MTETQTTQPIPAQPAPVAPTPSAATTVAQQAPAQPVAPVQAQATATPTTPSPAAPATPTAQPQPATPATQPQPVVQTEQLAEKAAPRPNPTIEKEKKQQEVQVVVFDLDNEEYAISIEDVLKVIEIPEITPIPNSPDFILGFINLAGKVISIIDLETKFTLQRTDQQKKPRHIIVVEGIDSSFGITVDQVNQVLRVPVNSLQEAPDIINNRIGQQYIKGVIVLQDQQELKEANRQLTQPTPQQKQTESEERILLQLDVKKLLNHDEQAVVAKVTAQATPTANQTDVDKPTQNNQTVTNNTN